MNIYLAAPVFTAAERAFNLKLADALEADGHRVYVPQRDAPESLGAGRTARLFRAHHSALQNADAVVAVCDGAQVDDGTAWEIGFAYARHIRVYGVRTDLRIVQQPDERINLMILEGLETLAPSIDALLDLLRRAGKP